MASELRVNTLKDAAGNNSIATSFVAGGSAKYWAMITNTGTYAVANSLSASSVTDDAAGNFTVTGITAMKILIKPLSALVLLRLLILLTTL